MSKKKPAVTPPQSKLMLTLKRLEEIVAEALPKGKPIEYYRKFCVEVAPDVSCQFMDMHKELTEKYPERTFDPAIFVGNFNDGITIPWIVNIHRPTGYIGVRRVGNPDEEEYWEALKQLQKKNLSVTNIGDDYALTVPDYLAMQGVTAIGIKDRSKDTDRKGPLAGDSWTALQLQLFHNGVKYCSTIQNHAPVLTNKEKSIFRLGMDAALSVMNELLAHTKTEIK